MKVAKRSANYRRLLDQRFRELGAAKRFEPPVQGWIKAVRRALGMSMEQLANRLKIKQPSLANIEQSEARGSIELATLRRAARALNCTLVYALIPNKPLETMVRDRARSLARKRRAHVEHSMLLEDQKVVGRNEKERLDEMIRETNPRLFWD